MIVSGEFSDETLLRELRNLRKDLDRLEVERLRYTFTITISIS